MDGHKKQNNQDKKMVGESKLCGQGHQHRWPFMLWSSVLTCLSLMAVGCCFILNGKIAQLEGEVRRLQSQDHQRFMQDDIIQKAMGVEVERLIQKVSFWLLEYLHLLGTCCCAFARAPAAPGRAPTPSNDLGSRRRGAGDYKNQS